MASRTLQSEPSCAARQRPSNGCASAHTAHIRTLSSVEEIQARPGVEHGVAIVPKGGFRVYGKFLPRKGVGFPYVATADKAERGGVYKAIAAARRVASLGGGVVHVLLLGVAS